MRPPNPRHLLLAAASLLGAAGAHAQQSSCAPVLAQVRSLAAEPTLDRGLGIMDLRARAAQLGGAGPTEGGTLTGLYESSTRFETAYNMSTQRSPNAMGVDVCFTQLGLTLSLEPSIHIVREIAPGGCAEQAVYAHEYTHHRIQMAKQAEASAAFAARNPLPTIPFHAPTQEMAIALAKAYVSAYSKSMSDSVANFARPAQAAFDSPQEYRRVSSLCPGEFAPLARQASGR